MYSILETIEKNKLINPGEIIGVAVSGGSDSMCLLDFLNENKQKLEIDIVAIHLDHSIRPTSQEDAAFVANFCKEKGIRLMKTRVDVPKYAKEKSINLELAARECRYNYFDAIINKGIVDKIALAHHMSDQAETILLHILRGSGLSGATGMSYVRGNYIRPMLNTDKFEIMSYINEHFIEYVTDETNIDNSYNRNFLRNEIMPLIKQKFPNAERTICAFGKNCKEDSDFIHSQINMDLVIQEGGSIKIPLNYFVYDNSIINRIIFKCLGRIGVNSDFERKHIELIKDLAIMGLNGSKLDLPNQVVATKEYEYITLSIRAINASASEKPFKAGKFKFDNFGIVSVKKTTNLNIEQCKHLIDAKKVPKGSVWRYRKDGDVFEKFGGGKKKLKSYLIDQKIPARLRDHIPVLAFENEILLIAGLEISNKVKIDETTKTAYAIDIYKI